MPEQGSSNHKPPAHGWVELTERTILLITVVLVVVVGALSLYVFGTVATP